MRRLYLSTKDSKIAGVCGGIGEMLDVDPNLIRLGVVFLCLVTAILPVLITYIAAWIIFPTDANV
jgi:phage shock protein C